MSAEGPPELAASSAPPTPAPAAGLPAGWLKHLLLFLATLLSVFLAGAIQELPRDNPPTLRDFLLNLHRGWTFAVPLMAILVTHEFGHYFAARIHRVQASLPYFIPLPLLSPFGTMGAVISMPERIRSRNALLDIGAAGPLAGMVVAIPVVIIGLWQSPVHELSGHGMQEGQCLLYWLLKRAVVGPIPEGHDVFLTPTAFAGWTGLLVTMLNLLPIGQLDGGHIAYALLGSKQDVVAEGLRWALLAAFAYNYWRFAQAAPGLVWVVWFFLLTVMRRLSGMNHPPTEPGELSPKRKLIAMGCVALFVLLFMPTPMRAY
jgi:membrane-associated protease RseP (regulator of RpoE activity)